MPAGLLLYARGKLRTNNSHLVNHRFLLVQPKNSNHYSRLKLKGITIVVLAVSITAAISIKKGDETSF